MGIICCTRFNNSTYNENILWKRINSYEGCIYNTPVKIKENIPLNIHIFVLEMNNDLNIILGIGCIQNHIYIDLKHKYSKNNCIKIYKENNYNRYTYKNNYRIDRSELNREELEYIKILDILLFKGSTHFKRGSGIQRISSWITDNKVFDFYKYINNLFIKKYNISF